MLAVVAGTCNPLDDWGRGLPMSSRLGLAIEWDHVSKNKTKQKTSRKLSPSPSLHPQTFSFNPLYQDLALHLLSLQVLPIFLVTLIRYRPSTRYPLKTRKLPRLQSFWTLTWDYKWKTPHQSLCPFTQRHWKFYTKWHLSCVCVRCEWNINSSVQTWAPPPSHSVLCIQILQHPKRIWNSKPIWSQAFQIRGTQSVLQDLFYHVVFDSRRGVCVAML